MEGALLGLHPSRRRGVSAEFAEVRDYRAGDDLRLVDWRLVGRSDRWFVKQFHEETHMSAVLLVDASASMGWSSRPGTLPTKAWYASLLAGVLGLLLLRQGDRVGLGVFDTEVRAWLPPRGGRGQEARLLRYLSELEPRGASAAGLPLREAALRLRRRGLVILLSDLLMEEEPAVKALRYLAHRGHEVVVAHVMDPGERALAGSGTRLLRDPESGTRLQVSLPEVRSAYAEAVEEALRRWRGALRGMGAGHHLVDTSAPPGRTLRELLNRRGSLAGGGR
jgi:uncharacterized protein (DUF58 family)